MTAKARRQANTVRATDRAGDPSPFVLGLLLRKVHSRVAPVMAEVLRPLGIELRHFAVLIVLVDRGPTEQRDLVEATGSDKAGIMRVVDDLERKGLAKRKSVPRGSAGAVGGDHPQGPRTLRRRSRGCGATD